MYEHFPPALQPGDNDTIWRYLDFTKFVAMLQTKSLFFRRVDLLGDPFEGWLPPRNLVFPPEIAEKLKGEIVNQSSAIPWAVRRSAFANCWHANKHESAAMWGLYLKSDEGVAIRSTFGRLKASFASAPQMVLAAKLVYVDPDAYNVPDDNALVPCLYKRKSFEHECEVRAIHWDHVEFSRQIRVRLGQDQNVEPSITGLNISVDLDTLIERVYVSPTKETWVYELVRATLDMYGFHHKETRKSHLSDDPIW